MHKASEQTKKKERQRKKKQDKYNQLCIVFLMIEEIRDSTY